MKDLTDFKPKRILACQLRQIGDVLLATPSLQLLKERYPEAELHLLTEKKCAPVLENNPHVDHVWEIDKKALKNPFKALAFYSKVGRSGYDLIVDFQQLPRCRWVILFSRAKVKLTMPPPWYNKPFYTHWGKTIYGYAAMCKASVIRPLGIEWNGERPKIWLSEAEKAWADKFIEQHGMQSERFVTIDPSHRRITRLWPARHFAGLIRLIREQHPDLKFFMLYGPGEKKRCRRRRSTGWRRKHRLRPYAHPTGNGSGSGQSSPAHRQLFRTTAFCRSRRHPITSYPWRNRLRMAISIR